MFGNRKTYGDMRRYGMGVGLSKAKLAEAMMDILLQLPTGTRDLKNTIVHHLGWLGEATATRDINAAWNEVKKKAARNHPGRFLLGPRDVLLWNDGTERVLDKTISAANYRALNDLAEAEGCTVNALVTRLVRHYKLNLPKE